MQRADVRSARGLAAVLTALACAACGGDSTSAEGSDWPPDTVLVVETLPITAAEVDRASVFVERIEPSATTPQLRRLTLSNVVLPNALARLLAPEARAAALREAEAASERLRGGGAHGPLAPEGELERVAGGWPELGLLTWGTAMDLGDGEWSLPLEEGGRFTVLRKVGRRDAELPIATVVEVDAQVFPYLDAATAPGEIERAYDRFRLTIVDPDWRTIVPELIQHRMRARQP